MKRYHKQCLIMILIAALSAGGIYCSGFTGKTEAMAEEYKNTEQDEAIENIVETVAGVRSTGEEGYDKEETVYVIADAEGNANEIIASEWLKNLEGSDKIEDISSLKDIVNVKGYEEYKAGNDNSLTWDAKGNDIYYQGTPTTESPVGVKVSYKLDGKKVTPDEIKGKSGKVEIRFDYENSTDEVIEVGDEEEHVNIPFTMLTGVIMPNDTFSNVEVENGRLISEGNNAIVIGYAFPGLYESLKYDEFKDNLDEDQREKAEDLDISDHVVITADAKDFELNSTLTVALPDVLEEVSFTDNIDTDEVKDDMDELADASQELIDGTDDLLDGVNDLKDGTDELKDGTSELKDGTRDLKDGTEDMVDGTKELMDGAWDMKEGACEAYGGTKKLYDGTKELKSGAGEAYEGSEALKDGISTAYKGSQTLYGGIGSAYAGSVSLNKGINSAYAGSVSLNQGVNTFATLITSKSGEIQLLQTLADTLSAHMNSSTASYDGNLANSSFGRMFETQQVLEENLYAMDIANENAMQSVSMLSLAVNSSDEDDHEDKLKTDIEEKIEEIRSSLKSAAYTAETASVAASDLEDMIRGISGSLDEEREGLILELEELEKSNPDNEDHEWEPDSIGDDSSDGSDETDDDVSDVDDSEESVSDDAEKDEEDDDEEDEEERGKSEEEIREYYKEKFREFYDEEIEKYKEYYREYYRIASCIEAIDSLKDELEGKLDAIEDSAVSMNEAASMLSSAEDGISELTAADLIKDDEDRTESFADNLNDSVVSANQANREAAESIRVVVEQLQDMKLLNVAYNAAASSEMTSYMQMLEMDDETLAKTLLAMDSETLNSTISGLLGFAQQYPAYAEIIQGKLESVLGTMSSSELSKLASKLDSPILSGLLASIDDKILAEKVAEGVDQLATTLTSDETKASLAKLTAGAGALETGLGIINVGSESLKDGLGTIRSGSKDLRDGLGTINKGSAKLKNGLSELYDGTEELKDGAHDLRDGTSELSNGGVELYDGTVDLHDGAIDLDDGAGDLNDGAQDLDDGVEELNDGVDELVDGAEELHDGMIEFNDEGIQKLIDLFGDNVTDMLDRLDAIQKTGSGYQSFSGKRDDMEGSVKFILKTGEIKAED